MGGNNESRMSNSKLFKYGFYCSVQCASVKGLSRKNWSELFENDQINLFCSTSSTIVTGDSTTAELARFGENWHNFFL